MRKHGDREHASPDKDTTRRVEGEVARIGAFLHADEGKQLLDVASVLQLQRIVGNTSVVELLTGRGEQPHPVRDVVGASGASGFQATADHACRMATLAPVQRQGPPVRSPTLEIAAVRMGGAFGPSSPLTPAERAIAEAVFSSGLNADVVRIVRTSIVAAPTTLGNNIRVPPGYRMPDNVLVHELTHIWQYQNHGSRYISDSLWHQTVSTLTAGSRGAAYSYQIVPGRRFGQYTAEQQAMIVEDWYSGAIAPADRPHADRLIATVRAGRPTVTPAEADERAGGLPPRRWTLPPSREPSFGNEAGTVPQLEFRFPGL